MIKLTAFRETIISELSKHVTNAGFLNVFSVNGPRYNYDFDTIRARLNRVYLESFPGGTKQWALERSPSWADKLAVPRIHSSYKSYKRRKWRKPQMRISFFPSSKYFWPWSLPRGEFPLASSSGRQAHPNRSRSAHTGGIRKLKLPRTELWRELWWLVSSWFISWRKNQSRFYMNFGIIIHGLLIHKIVHFLTHSSIKALELCSSYRTYDTV